MVFELPESSETRRQESEASSPLAKPVLAMRNRSTSLPGALGVRLTGAGLGFHQREGLRPQPLSLPVSHFPVFTERIIVNVV